ncbi:MAG: hypothetical protein RIA69_13125 [Cyclobacteriaceae bacterium]
MRKLMLIVSAVFHPLLMSTYSCIILYFLLPVLFSPIPINAIPYFIITIFLTTVIVPALSILLMKYSKQISHLDITDRKERKIPFLTIGLFYALTTYMMYQKMSLNPVIFKLMILVTSSIILIALISMRYKISVHAAAIWGVAGFFSALSSFYYTKSLIIVLPLLFLFSGLTVFARLKLGRHTPNETWLGALFGFLYFYFGFSLVA